MNSTTAPTVRYAKATPFDEELTSHGLQLAIIDLSESLYSEDLGTVRQAVEDEYRELVALQAALDTAHPGWSAVYQAGTIEEPDGEPEFLFDLGYDVVMYAVDVN